MNYSFDIWKLLTGVAIFLLGMNFLEEALRQLAGRPFKLFLKRHTSNKLKAIAGGAIVTGVLQSSSVVNLMVLAFVGAGVITMKNALAVILGANLGTTLGSWIVAMVGFKYNIESIAFPITGLAGIATMLLNKEGRWHQWTKFLFGFGFLFVGLNFMRTGIENLVKQVDLSDFNKYPVIVFMLTGLLITSLIQSSSATIAIVLSALFVNVITLYSAMAIVLGSEIGTTLKLLFASVKGVAAKKRVALGNFLFNIITAALVLIFLHPVNRFITDVAGITDELMALVFFQSLVNLIGIILFYPLLNVMGRFLEKRFTRIDEDALFIHKVTTADTGLALDALEKETINFLYHVTDFSLSAFEMEGKLEHIVLPEKFRNQSLLRKYDYIKYFHGEIYAYCMQVHKNSCTKEEIEKLDKLISAIRNGMYAAKSMKDALHDAEMLHNSSNDSKYNFYLQTSKKVAAFYTRGMKLIQQQNQSKNYEELVCIYKEVQDGYSQTLNELYKDSLSKNLSEIEFSSLINFNREIYTSFKAMSMAIKDYLLDAREAEYFDALPGFIR